MCCLNIIEEFKQPLAWPSNSDDLLSNFINVFLGYLERAVFVKQRSYVLSQSANRCRSVFYKEQLISL